jgi:hypothetical protein
MVAWAGGKGVVHTFLLHWHIIQNGIMNILSGEMWWMRAI